MRRLQAYEIAAFGLLAIISLASLVWPIVDYDSWSYHFPFSARLWGGYVQLSPMFEQRWVGFPKAWEWIQGVFWLATGDKRAMLLPQMALFGAYLWFCTRKLRVPAALLILGFFASPLLFIHYQSLYLDLPAGLCLALGFFLLMTDRPWFAIAFLGLAGNIKVQALLSAVLIVVVCIVAAAVEFRWSKRTARVAMGGGLALMLASISVASTWQRTGNPLYPFEVKVGQSVIFAGPENPMIDANPPRYAIGGRLISPPQPVAFALSATELDWIIRGVPMGYDITSNLGDKASNGTPSRTGGWGWPFVLLNGLLLLAQIVRKQKLAVATAVLIVATAFLPRSHELRYWLFLPLILLPINLRYVAQRVPEKALGTALMVVAGWMMLQTALTTNSYIVFGRSGLIDRN